MGTMELKMLRSHTKEQSAHGRPAIKDVDCNLIWISFAEYKDYKQKESLRILARIDFRS